MPNLAIISGEISGDLVGGALAQEIRSLTPNVELWGIGSRRMQESGVELIADSSRWSAIGVIEALKVYPELRFKMYPMALKEIEKRRPSAVILIDFGAFNMKVARWCKARGIKILYYFPPGSWKRRGRSGEELARVADRIATPFPWSAERLKAFGANVEFVGHPLLEIVKPQLSRSVFCDRFGLDAGQAIIGLLPGSRDFEIEHNTPAMLGAASIIQNTIPGVQFVFGLANRFAAEQVEEHVKSVQAKQPDIPEPIDAAATIVDMGQKLSGTAGRQLVTPEGVVVPESALSKSPKSRSARNGPAGPLPIVLVESMTYDVMAHSDVLLTCSGTATLEAAILGTPMVILYRGSLLMEYEAKLRRVKPEHIGLPNIILGERAVPEFIQHDATPENLSEQVLRLLREPDTRSSMMVKLGEVRRILGKPGASRRTAEIALQLAGLEPDAHLNPEMSI